MRSCVNGLVRVLSIIREDLVTVRVERIGGTMFKVKQEVNRNSQLLKVCVGFNNIRTRIKVKRSVNIARCIK